MLKLTDTNLLNDIQDLAAHQVAQADTKAAQAAENLRNLIARKFGDEQAAAVKAEINVRLMAIDIPDADENSSAAEAIAAYEAIAAFYAVVTDQIKAGTFPAPVTTPGFTHSTPMDAEAFWARVKRGDATVIQASGYADVYNTAGEHVARWLGAGVNVLWYTPQEAKAEWPPRCPTCESQMIVKRQGGTGLPFWSCANFPFCRGRRDFTAHPDDIAEIGDAYKARYASLERATALGLVEVSARGKRQARRRGLERARLDARDTALPVQHTTGRAKLFKG